MVGVVIVGPALIVMVKEPVEALTPAASVTFMTMPLKVPVAVGVPEIVPVDVLSVRPLGSAEPVEA